MSETIERKKPSKLNEFEGDFTGNEIIQVTRPNVGTYKVTTSKLRGYMGELTPFDGIVIDENPTILEDATGYLVGIPAYLEHQKSFAAPLRNHQQRLVGYLINFDDKDVYMEESEVKANKIFFNMDNGRQYSWVNGALMPQYQPVVLTQAEYDALEEKDQQTTYYIYEE